MTKVAQLMQLESTTPNDIGVEIEVEGNGIPQATMLWNNERDGSLQGESMEYVLKRPSTLDEVRKALNYLGNLWTKSGTTIHDAVRAGVHVHINCQHLTILELYNFFTLFLIFENSLVKWCGPTRQGNLFCLRSCDADWMITQLRNAAKTKKFWSTFRTDNLRYAAMNVKALTDYGSVEFRSMRSDGNLGEVYKWVKVLYELREHAKTFAEPPEIISEFSMIGPEAFAKKYLGDLYKELDIDDKDLYRGVRYAQDVAYAVPEWSVFISHRKKVGNLEFDESHHALEPEVDF